MSEETEFEFEAKITVLFSIGETGLPKEEAKQDAQEELERALEKINEIDFLSVRSVEELKEK